jgi:hypothetical protein
MRRLLKYVSALSISLIMCLAIVVPVLAASVTLSENKGTVGSIVTIDGSGFAPSSSFNLYFDSTFEDTIGSDSNGDLESYDFTIPEKPAGSHTIKVGTTSKSFTIIPKITLSSTSGSAGTYVTVTGKGFNDNDEGITVLFDTTNVINTDSDGNGS